MRRYTAVLLLFVFSLSIFLVPQRAAACSMSMSPIPLRSLYASSGVIVVGRLGKPGDWTANEFNVQSNADSQIYTRRVPVIIEETIKGYPPQDLAITESTYRSIKENGPVAIGTVLEARSNSIYSNVFGSYNENEDDAEAKESETEENQKPIQRSKLLFLNDVGDGVFALAYSPDGFRRFGANIDIYVKRLRELNAIYAGGGRPSKQAVVEWLVTMAEDSATRFEGADELRKALEEMTMEDGMEDEDEEEVEEEAVAEVVEEKAAAKEISTVKTETARPVIANGYAGSSREADITDLQIVELPINGRRLLSSAYRKANDVDFATGDVELARALTSSQKERLIQAASALRFNYQKTKIDLGDGEFDEDAGPILAEADRHLLEAVAYLKDSRVTARLLAELPAAAQYDPTQASEFMRFIAVYFDDEKMDDLTDKYNGVDWGEENELIDREDRADDSPPEKVGGAKATAIKNKAAYQPVKTYGQRRAELLQQIVTHGGTLLAKEKKAAAKKK